MNPAGAAQMALIMGAASKATNAATPHLPSVSWKTPGPVASKNDINSVATSPREIQAQTVGENAPLRVIYGRVRLGAQVPTVLAYQNDLIMLLVWGEGEIQEIESVTVGDETPPAGITMTHYTGTAGQTADPTLVAAFAAQSITYADALPGIAYTVARVPQGKTSGFPTFQAIIKGRKLYDQRKDSTAGGSGSHRLATQSTWEYSDNPALALADFERSTTYGRGRTVNAASLIAAADYCDTLCGAEKRRLIGLVIDNTQPCSQWLEALRTYAGCFIPTEGAETLLVPDKPGSVEMSFTTSNIVAGSLNKLKKSGIQQIPTVVEVLYTDTSVTPWAEKSAVAKAAGVDAGTTPRRESQISLPGITRYTQAYREAVERLNKLSLSDLSCTFDTFDEALKLQVGAIVDVTHPIGLTAKQMRAMPIELIEPGRWRISAFEYDPAAYSDAVATAPTYTDTTLPNPAAPPAVENVRMAEEVYQLENGTYASRFRVTWDAVSYPYLARYRAELWNGATLIHNGSTDTASWPTPAVQEGVSYTAKVYVISSVAGAVSDVSTQSATAQGKQLIPGDVPSVSAFEAGGTVYGSIEPAVDIDIWRYEWKYGPVGVSYDSATLLDLVDGLRYQTSIIPPGTWTLHVKAVDSVRQRSLTAATCQVTVTIDAAAFLVSTYDQTNPTVANMVEYRLAPTDTNRYWVTDNGATMASIFTDPTLAGYTNILSTYHPSCSATWTGEAEDFGMGLSGSWSGACDTTVLSGAPSSHIQLSDNAVDWSTSPSTAAKDTARFARLLHKSDGTDTLKVSMGTQQVRLDAIPRVEVGTFTTSASGPVTITLGNVYTACKSLKITMEGTTARSGTYDNIVIGSPTTFDVYGFDIAGNKIVSAGRYEWEGV